MLAFAIVSTLSGCNSGPEALQVEVPTSDGELVMVKGPARTVQSLQSKVADLRTWAEDAKKWHDRYRDSRKDLESATADKCARDVKRSCTEILEICSAIRKSSEMMAVSSATLLVDDYEAFAKRMLADVRAP